MEVKKNLNNVQRKMLDQIYTEQFDKRAKSITEDREKGLAVLKTKLLKETYKDKEVKKMIDAGNTFYMMHLQLKEKLAANGVYVEGSLSRQPLLDISRGYYGSRNGEFAEVTEYNAKSREIELTLSEKKKEMRAKIYGVAASYEEVDQEIKDLLKNV